MLQLMVALAGAPEVADKPPASRHTVVEPNWARKPYGEEIEWFYPPSAMVLGLEGRTMIRCRVRLDGSTSDCRVLSEEPAGYGFGQAGLAAAARFKFTPLIIDGQPTDEGQVNVPVSFKGGELVGSRALGPARRCAAWAQATEEAMSSPDAQFPAWAYVFWRFRFTAFAVASGMKPSEITQAIETDTKWAAPGRKNAERYGDCAEAAFGAWPNRPVK